MYEEHWGLQKTPFASDRTAESYFTSRAHQSALLKLRFLIEHRRGAGLLVGPSGVGKTRLLQELLSQDDSNPMTVVQVVYPMMSPLELLCFIVTELGDDHPAGVGTSLDVVLKQLIQQLRAETAKGRPTVIVIDDAHAITDRQVFQSLHLLLNFQQYTDIEFTLILAGQPELVGMTKRLPQLDDRITVPCVLNAMSATETADYMQHCLKSAGGTEPIFTKSAMQTVHELTGGLPRRINRLCDFALVVGFAEHMGLIDAQHVEAVSNELNLGRAA